MRMYSKVLYPFFLVGLLLNSFSCASDHLEDPFLGKELDLIRVHNSNVLNKYRTVAVLVHTKVASRSLQHLFRESTYNPTIGKRRTKTIHTHDLEKGMRLLEDKNRVLVISVVRNLFDKNISAFFQFLDGMRQFACSHNPEDYNVQELLNEFAHFYSLKETEEVSGWYAKFNEIFDIDYSQYPFDFSKKYIFIPNHGKYDILILRYEDIEEWNDILQSVIGLKNVSIPTHNVGRNKWYKDLYDDFKSRYYYSPEEVEKILNVEFMKTFYTNDEIGGFIDKHNLSK